ncbi:uncharacterized protein LOC129566798 [Sitodiplosis mosellana]|uniref:uncharacterized protein LOC129566798 n=1 Tax=Sitodiplosis mosellana TaxID=263140 RepID=UPI002443D1A7|nr:uncharacterized protein LOC129566798 [Sitodiplosis mosellana]
MRVSHCCRLHYFNDLKIGGLIIGFFEVALGIALIIIDLTNPKYFIPAVIRLVFSVCWLYGIEKSRPNYMFPNLVVSSVSVLLLLIGIIVVMFVLVYLVFFNKPIPNIDGIPIIVLITFILCCFTLVYSYMWVIIHSVYKAVKDFPQGQISRNYSQITAQH